jgi:hypothetical protein
MTKIGRNERCPCGSGRKYKHCHGELANQARIERALEAADAHRRRVEALEEQRRAQQGLGKPILSTVVSEHRLVASGNRVYFGKSWKTFPDFLTYFLTNALGPDWGNAELKKVESEMHPVALWYRKYALLQAAHQGVPGNVFSAPETGAAHAYLELAYNLYLLEHNAELRSILVDRLKSPGQFMGALSEIRVAGMLVRAGFSIKFHDETDLSRTHCEYDAVRLSTGKRFSVEVKTRHWRVFPKADSEGKRRIQIAVGRLLRDALYKQADNERIVFVELAMPDESHSDSKVLEPWWLQSAIDGIRLAERQLRKTYNIVPAATVIVSNHPYHLHLESTRSIVAFAVDGIGPTDFRSGLRGTIREALRFRRQHTDFLALWKSIEIHRYIPQTFDGSSYHLAFGEHPPQLVVGGRYKVPDANGCEGDATLEDAVALPSERKIYGIYRTDAGERVTCTDLTPVLVPPGVRVRG